jgi:hypothetical protein
MTTNSVHVGAAVSFTGDRQAPDWVKLLDFETTIPKAVEDLIHAYQAQNT